MMQKKQMLSAITIGVLITIVLSNSTMPLIETQDQEEMKEVSGMEWAEKMKAAADPDAFISIWDTTLVSDGSSASNQVRLPLEDGGTYDFNVTWGDGTNDTIAGWDQTEITHNYSSSGLYAINITGTITGWRFNNGGDRLKIVEILQWGALRVGNAGSYFSGCENLNLTTTDTLDLTGTTSLYMAFRTCTSLGSSGNLNEWDVSSVTGMDFMFYNAHSFNQPLNAWNVSNVTSMVYTFAVASSFNQPLDSWDVSSVTSMRAMFWDAASFNLPLDAWNVSSVVKMGGLFQDTSFNQPLNSWDVSSVTDMGRMFWHATSFNQPLNAWDVSSVLEMDKMFAIAISFNQPLNAWDVSNVMDMSLMFSTAQHFNQSLETWDVSNVKNMGGMFGSALSFNQPLDTWDVSNVTSMNAMFSNPGAFNQSLETWDVSNVKNMGSMFYNAHSFNQPLDSWDVSSVTSMHSMFSEAKSFNQFLDAWDVSNVKDMGSMFYKAQSFNQSLNSWDVSSVTTMKYMFWDATLFNQPLNTWDVSSVTDMSNMFNGVTLSTSNYGFILWSWSQLQLQSGVVFHAGNSQYGAGFAETARQLIVDTFNWTISDGGLVPVSPNAPVLNEIEGPSHTGNITLSWNTVEGATNYSIFRSLSPIIDVNGLMAIITGLNETTYQDTGLLNGIYFYVVVATNDEGDFLPSNCEIVVVIIVQVPNAPVLNEIESPSSSGHIILTWNTVEGATNYRIYRSSSPITDVTGLTAINSWCTDGIYRNDVSSNGTYYYVVVATNDGGSSQISNCESVVVALISETTTETETKTTTSTSTTDSSTTDGDSDGIAGFPPLWFGIMILGVSIGLVWYLRPRRH